MTDYVIPPASPTPVLRAVAMADLKNALRDGWADFRAEPWYGLLFGGVFALGGVAMLWLLYMYNAPWMIIPLAIGFPLLGPFAAAGLYEISRRRSAGEPVDGGVFSFMWRQRRREFSWMAFVVLFIFWIWMYQARILLAIFLGASASFSNLGDVILTTSEGYMFLGVGTLVGAVLSLILFSVTVFSMPILVDREHDMVTAIVASVKAVLDNPAVMLTWGAIVSALTLLAMTPLFLGLIVALPVLGHATWRLYRSVLTNPL